MTDDRENPVDQLIDNLVYAPLGLAVEARANWSSYVERGRSQIAISRFVARAATRKGASTAETIAERLANDVGQVIVDLFGIDLTPDPEPSTEPATAVEFPIAGYDDLTAKEIVAELDGLSELELELVRAHEADGKARVTVLRAIERQQRARP